MKQRGGCNKNKTEFWIQMVVIDFFINTIFRDILYGVGERIEVV